MRFSITLLKFVPTALALAGVASPIWLWHADQSDFSVQRISQAPLYASAKDTVPDLEISIGGSPLVEPYLSVIKILNSGGKPLRSADFESALELRSSSATIVGARVTAKAPEDIRAAIAWDERSVRLNPTLLNPDDNITISIISSGRPDFSVSARIIGVPSVRLIDPSGGHTSDVGHWLLFLVLSLIVFPAGMLQRGVLQGRDIFNRTVLLRTRTVLIAIMAMVLAGGMSWAGFLLAYGVDSLWLLFIWSIAYSLVGYFIGSRMESDDPPPITA